MSNILTRVSFAVILVGMLSSCGSSIQTVHHWKARSDIGPNQFVIDHNLCMREADSWPFEKSFDSVVDTLSPGPHDPKHRLDPNSSRTWASFIPYNGAQVVYVNDPNSSSSVNDNSYESCMKKKGYYKAYDTEIRKHLINDRSKGYREDAS